MELLLLKFFAILRPVMFIWFDKEIFGLNIFELAAIAFFAALTFALLVRAAVRKNIKLTEIDFVIAAFLCWCVAGFFAHYEETNISELAKLTIPFFTYTVAKNIIEDDEQYSRIIFLMIVGFSVPVILSALLISQGQGLEKVLALTGLPRYRGVYQNPHNMAHNMTMFIMLMVTYITIMGLKRSVVRIRFSFTNVFFLAMAALGLFNLYQSYVRTSYLGLALFVSLFLFFLNKKLWVLWVIVLFLGLVLAAPTIQTIFLDVVQIQTGERSIDSLGSGRLFRWQYNLAAFTELSLDKQLAGVGIHNPDAIQDSHSDFVHMLMITGAVGFFLFIIMHLLFLRAIFRLETTTKYLFLAIFIAISFMNVVSNSYFGRFGLTQMYLLLLAYLEIPKQPRTDFQSVR